MKKIFFLLGAVATLNVQAMSTRVAHVTAGVLACAATSPLIYETHKAYQRGQCCVCRPGAYMCSDHRSHLVISSGITVGLCAAAIAACRFAPRSAIARARNALQFENILSADIKTIIQSEQPMQQKMGRLSEQYVLSRVPLARATSHVNSRLESLVEAQKSLNYAKSLPLTYQEHIEILSLQEKVKPEIVLLRTFLSELKQTPEYNTALNTQASLDHVKAAQDNAAANQANATANTINALRPR